MIDEKIKKAFERLANIATDVVGDMCKNDLVLIGTSLGMTEPEMQQEFPNLYERGDVSIEDFKDEDEPVEEESTEEDEPKEEE
jgi:hypothetical protein